MNTENTMNDKKSSQDKDFDRIVKRMLDMPPDPMAAKGRQEKKDNKPKAAD